MIRSEWIRFAAVMVLLFVPRTLALALQETDAAWEPVYACGPNFTHEMLSMFVVGSLITAPVVFLRQRRARIAPRLRMFE